jgi:plasmid stabilization system protein ParE
VEVVYLAGTESDLLDAWRRHEELAPGRGQAFDSAVRAGETQLAQFPRSGPLYHAGFRRLVLRPFNYGVFYTVHGHRVIISAVLSLHLHREFVVRRLLE